MTKPESQCPEERKINDDYTVCCAFQRGHTGPHGTLPMRDLATQAEFDAAGIRTGPGIVAKG